MAEMESLACICEFKPFGFFRKGHVSRVETP
jgi:hypothetical protein